MTMDQLIEFVGNHAFLFGAFAVVLIMVIKAEIDHQSGRASQLDPTAAIRLMNNNDAVILDVRESKDFDEGHIKNAKNIPLMSIKDKLDQISSDKSRAILTYCRSGNISGKACSILKKSGFSNVHNISGGITNWQDANLPLTKN